MIKMLMIMTISMMMTMATDLPNSLLQHGDTVPGQRLRGRSLLGPAAPRRNPLPCIARVRGDVGEMQGYEEKKLKSG